jgi:hypothetical protein
MPYALCLLPYALCLILMINIHTDLLNCLFKIPLNEGNSALCFSSEHLIGVITEPPIWVKQMQDVNVINTKY